MYIASIRSQYALCLISLANQLFPIILLRSTFAAERAGMIQITARGEGGTNIFRPSRGFHLLAWCPGNALPALRVCVCVRMCVGACVQASVCVYVRMRALYCVCRTTEQSFSSPPLFEAAS